MKNKRIIIGVIFLAIILVLIIQTVSCTKQNEERQIGSKQIESEQETTKNTEEKARLEAEETARVEAEEKAKAEAEAQRLAEIEANKTVVEKSGIKEVDKTRYVAKATNFRKDATSDSENLGSFNRGVALRVTGEVGNGWQRVNYNGKVGYVEGSYLTDTKPVVQKATPKKTSSSNTSSTQKSTSAPSKTSSSNTSSSTSGSKSTTSSKPSSGGTAKAPAPKPSSGGSSGGSTSTPAPSGGGMNYTGAPTGEFTNFD